MSNKTGHNNKDHHRSSDDHKETSNVVNLIIEDVDHIGDLNPDIEDAKQMITRASRSGHKIDSGSTTADPIDHKDSSARRNDPENLKTASVTGKRGDQYLVNRSKANSVRKTKSRASKTKKRAREIINNLGVSNPKFKELKTWLNSSSVVKSPTVPADRKDSSSRSNDPEKLNAGSVDADESDRYLVNRSEASRVREKRKEKSNKNVNVLDVRSPKFKKVIARINSSSVGKDQTVSRANTSDHNKPPDNVAESNVRIHSEKDAKGDETDSPAGNSSQLDPNKQ